MRRPPALPLFPYTTLFRSHGKALDQARGLFASTMAELVVVELEEHDRLIAFVLGLSHALNIAFFTALADRKSTRLNSSHLVISYAVVCLKKKKGKCTQNS